MTVQGYVGRNCLPRIKELPSQELMHRRIMRAAKGQYVHHKNHDPLDNRRENLTLCTNAENNRHRYRQSNNTSGYKGVSQHVSGLWKAYIKLNGKQHTEGYHKTKEGAARAYNRMAIEHYGEFALLNEVSDETR